MNQRQQILLTLLKQKKVLSIEQLSKALLYSTSTVRRDLSILQERGMVKLEKGIAKLIISNSKERHFKLRNTENVDKKEKIAKACEEFFRDGMSLFLDSSSTTLHICQILREYRNLTVVTNGIEIAHQLMSMTNVEVFVVGGYMREGTSSIIGEAAIDYIKQFNVDLAIISCYGIDERGVYDVSMQQAYVKRAMMSHAKTRVLLCDSTKFDKVYKFTIGSFKSLEYVVSEQPVSELIGEALKNSDCENLYSN